VAAASSQRQQKFAPCVQSNEKASKGRLKAAGGGCGGVHLSKNARLGAARKNAQLVARMRSQAEPPARRPHRFVVEFARNLSEKTSL